MPMLRWISQTRKVKRKANGTLEEKTKDRPISYAAHKDAAIYSYYGHLLSGRYESELAAIGISDSITAFRPDTGRCNIDFAHEALEWIRNQGECVAIAFDIKSFFDNLDHEILKAQWRRLLKVERLPDDHFAVFSSLTRFAFADRTAVFKEFGISPHNPRATGRSRICSPNDFRERVRAKGLIQKNGNRYGIPQGSPMSAILSNIYMLDFDAAVSERVQAADGLYRRYCDDMLIVLSLEHAQDIEDLVMAQIKTVKLEIQPEKTKRQHFRSKGDRLTVDEPLQYLGFLFDGARILVRNGSVSRYYRKMRAAVSLVVQTKRKHDRIRAHQGKPLQQLKRRKLNIRYSYVGRHNFLSYAQRAAKKMSAPAIRKQVKRHWKKLNAEVDKVATKLLL